MKMDNCRHTGDSIFYGDFGKWKMLLVLKIAQNAAAVWVKTVV